VAAAMAAKDGVGPRSRVGGNVGTAGPTQPRSRVDAVGTWRRRWQRPPWQTLSGVGEGEDAAPEVGE
jgi:hypothetical protein